MEAKQEAQSPYLSGDIPVECMGSMPVSSTAARGPGTVYTGAQWKPVQVQPLGAQPPQKGTQPHSPSQTHIHFNCPLCPREKTCQSIAASVAVHEREAHSGRETAFLKTWGDRYKRHAARIDMVSVTSMATFTQTSAGSRVGAIKHPPRPYPRILMDWVASPLRENQPSP